MDTFYDVDVNECHELVLISYTTDYMTPEELEAKEFADSQNG